MLPIKLECCRARPAGQKRRRHAYSNCTTTGGWPGIAQRGLAKRRRAGRNIAAQKAATPCKWRLAFRRERRVCDLLSARYLDACISRPRGGRGVEEKKMDLVGGNRVRANSNSGSGSSLHVLGFNKGPASDFSNHRENHRGWCCLSGTSHCDSKRALLLYRMWLAESRAGSQWPSPVPVSPDTIHEV